MQDLGFIIAAYGVILGGLALRRPAAAPAAARDASLRIRRQAESAPPAPDSRA